MIDVQKYRREAAVAADALRAAVLAVEACGADVDLTGIVAAVAGRRTQLCSLFSLPAHRESVVVWLDETGGDPKADGATDA